MIPSLMIAAQDWMTAPPAQAVMQVLSDNTEIMALFVGGCVRNTLLGEPVSDIDIATKHTPKSVMKIMQGAGIKCIPTGIEHGTVTAFVDDCKFEITTLRRDVATDGRRAVVAFSTDWAEDAARRDFTMNTLLADAAGRIYDPLGAGLADLRAGRVVFVGDAAERVREDYLRILRFFRFHARYGGGAPDEGALAACRAGVGGLGTLSRERVTDEFLKILATDKLVPVLRLMFENNILGQFYHGDYQEKVLSDLIELQKDGFLDALPRLAVLAGFDESYLSKISQYIVLSNESWRRLDLYIRADTVVPDARRARLWVYRYGNDEAWHMAALHCARAGRAAMPGDVADIVRHWPAPRLPVGGADIMAAGVAEGPGIGRILDRIEAWWIENDFVPDEAACAVFLESLVRQS